MIWKIFLLWSCIIFQSLGVGLLVTVLINLVLRIASKFVIRKFLNKTFKHGDKAVSIQFIPALPNLSNSEHDVEREGLPPIQELTGKERYFSLKAITLLPWVISIHKLYLQCQIRVKFRDGVSILVTLSASIHCFRVQILVGILATLFKIGIEKIFSCLCRPSRSTQQNRSHSRQNPGSDSEDEDASEYDDEDLSALDTEQVELIEGIKQNQSWVEKNGLQRFFNSELTGVHLLFQLEVDDLTPAGQHTGNPSALEKAIMDAKGIRDEIAEEVSRTELKVTTILSRKEILANSKMARKAIDDRLIFVRHALDKIVIRHLFVEATVILPQFAIKNTHTPVPNSVVIADHPPTLGTFYHVIRQRDCQKCGIKVSAGFEELSLSSSRRESKSRDHQLVNKIENEKYIGASHVSLELTKLFACIRTNDVSVPDRFLSAQQIKYTALRLDVPRILLKNTFNSTISNTSSSDQYQSNHAKLPIFSNIYLMIGPLEATDDVEEELNGNRTEGMQIIGKWAQLHNILENFVPSMPPCGYYLKSFVQQNKKKKKSKGKSKKKLKENRKVELQIGSKQQSTGFRISPIVPAQILVRTDLYVMILDNTQVNDDVTIASRTPFDLEIYTSIEAGFVHDSTATEPVPTSPPETVPIVQMVSAKVVKTRVTMLNSFDLVNIPLISFDLENHLRKLDTSILSNSNTLNNDVPEIFDKDLHYISNQVVSVAFDPIKVHAENSIEGFANLMRTPIIPKPKSKADKKRKVKAGACKKIPPVTINFACPSIEVFFIDRVDRFPSSNGRCLLEPYSVNLFLMDILGAVKLEEESPMETVAKVAIGVSSVLAAVKVTPLPFKFVTGTKNAKPILPNSTSPQNPALLTLTAYELSAKLAITPDESQPGANGTIVTKEILFREWIKSPSDISPLAIEQASESNYQVVVQTKTLEVNLHSEAADEYSKGIMEVKLTFNSLVNANWCGLFMWNGIAAIFSIQTFIKSVKEIIKINSGAKLGPSSPNTNKPVVKIIMEAKDLISAHLYVGLDDVVDVECRGLELRVSDIPTRKKPDVSVQAGHIIAYMNNHKPPAADVRDFVFKDSFRLASAQEMEVYNSKRIPFHAENPESPNEVSDDVVCDFFGRPLVEEFHLGVGNGVARIAPKLEFGKVINGVEMAHKTIIVALLENGMKLPSGRKENELMLITAAIQRADFSILDEDTFVSNKSNLPPYLHRFRALARGVTAHIDRMSPPSHRKAHLNILDEDPNYREYGPPVQGGEMLVKIQKAVVIMHPLTLAVPLLVVKELRWDGYFMLANLSPDTPNIKPGRVSDFPMSTFPSSGKQKSGFLAVPILSRGVPPKVFFDGALRIKVAESAFSIDVQKVAPLVSLAFKRVEPPPPEGAVSSPPVGPWDAMRFFMHGKISIKVKRVAFRWLLDSMQKPDCCIMIQTQKILLSHSVGRIKAQFSSLVVSVPREAYPLYSSTATDAAEKYSSGLRHSLVLIPIIELDVGLKWNVLLPEETSPLEHHSPYLIYPKSSGKEEIDKFYRFRSTGVIVKLSAKISGEPDCSNWIACRIDVLPWLTHKGHRFAELAAGNGTISSEENKPKLVISNIAVRASLEELRVALWYGMTDASGVCVVVRRAALEMTKVEQNASSKTPGIRIDLNLRTLLAVRFDIPTYEKDINPEAIQQHGTKSDSDPIELYDRMCGLFGASRHTRSDVLLAKAKSSPEVQGDEKAIFGLLKECYEATTAVDYLLEASSILLMDRSIAVVQRECGIEDKTNLPTATLSLEQVLDDLILDKQTWTVLVAGLKLLWTTAIRDMIIMLVGDLIMTTELMMLQLKLKSSENSAHLIKKEVGQVRPTMVCLEDVLAKGKLHETNQIGEIAMRQSNLLRLLRNDSGLDRSDESSDDGQGRPKRSLLSHENSFLQTNDIEENPALPALDVHLCNAQVQLHSDQTGGSIILAIRGAYVQGLDFQRYYADFSDLRSKGDDYSQKNEFARVLRKKEFRFQLDRVEAFAVDSGVDIGAGLMWLELPPASSNSSSSRIDLISQYYSAKDFLVPGMMRRIMNQFSFHTKQQAFRQPLDLSKDEVEDMFKMNSIIKVGGQFRSADCIIDSVQCTLDELSFVLDSHQFSTTVNLFRYLILAPPPKPRQAPGERIIEVEGGKNVADDVSEMSDDEEVRTKLKTVVRATDGGEEVSQSSASSEEKDVFDPESMGRAGESNQFMMEKTELGDEYIKNVLDTWRASRGRKLDRDTLRNAIQAVAGVLEEQHLESRMIRHISWSLSKVGWKIYSPDFIDDIEISLTNIQGQHDFFADSGITTQVELEDVRITSLMPSPEAQTFVDPSAILTNNLDGEMSPCIRCGEFFDRAWNHSHACCFHGDAYGKRGLFKSGVWTCCSAMQFEAKGCKARPHTGRERFALIRIENLPRVADGLTLYKHIEINVYPEVPHTLVVQMTKNIANLLMAYFLGDTGDVMNNPIRKESEEDFLVNIEGGATPLDGSTAASEEGSSSPSKDALKKQALLGVVSKQKTISKFGRGRTKSDEISSSLTSGASKLTSEETVVSGTSLAGNKTITGRNVTKTKVSSEEVAIGKNNGSLARRKSNATTERDDAAKAADGPKLEELVFMKHMRIGNIRIEISLVGFPVEIRNYGIGVPSFSRAYKIGNPTYLSKKYVAFLVSEVLKSAANSGMNKV